MLGIVHGVQPATGAAAAYKRIRAGFEDPGMWNNRDASIGAKIAGNFGNEVTAVLANSPGGLELLPSRAYGNGWLQVHWGKQVLASWPKNGDPYQEIYKVKGKWYSLLQENWINPSNLLPDLGGGTFERTAGYLDKANAFHQAIETTYHPVSYAHYGADPARRSFGDVVWSIGTNCTDTSGWDGWPILRDTRQGCIDLVDWAPGGANKNMTTPTRVNPQNSIQATILPPAEEGDETVPVRSSDHQLKSSKFKGIFRQLGYDHQGSYGDELVLAATLYSIVRIAQQAIWKESQ